jgi:hypothetical protein
MAWRLAKSLVVFRNELNAIAPNRSKRSDGTIGDAAHAASDSDHNENDAGVVCAFDGTHDPAGGADMAAITEFLRLHPPRALKYMIFNRRICSRKNGWKWVAYHGSNPHDKHAHFSTGEGPDGHSTGPYDDTTPWGIASGLSLIGGDMIGLKRGDEGEEVLGLQYVLADAGFDPGAKDRVYGPKVSAAVLACRKSLGSSAKDGDEITGTAYAQILRALIKKQAPAAAPTSAQVATAVAVYFKANPVKLPESIAFASGTFKGIKAA